MSSERTITSPDISPDAMRAYRAAKALHRDGGSPASAFGLLAAIVEDRTWERLCDNSDRPFPSFTAFVEAPEPGGLATSRSELVKLLALRHPHEDGDEWKRRAPWLREEIARLLNDDIPAVGEHGNGPGRGHKKSVRDANTLQRSDTASRTIARLKRDDPEMAERVINKELSANAAACQKGWKKPKITLSSPSSVAMRLRQHFTPQQVAELRTLLDDP